MENREELVVAITGGGRGIGASTAKVLAEEGARVFICGRTQEDVERVAAGSERIEGSAVDISDEEAVNQWMRSISSKAGRLDVLINNASVLGPREYLDETSVEGWRKTIEINITGTFLVTRAAYPLLRRSKRPVVINLSSSVGRRGRRKWGAYSVSKFGAEGLAEVAADELAGDGAVVVTLNPGGTATGMRAEAYPQEDPSTLPDAGEVAQTVALLVRMLTPAQNGEKYNSRELFSLVENPPASASDLPREG